jgi:hypothetical protein
MRRPDFVKALHRWEQTTNKRDLTKLTAKAMSRVPLESLHAAYDNLASHN